MSPEERIVLDGKVIDGEVYFSVEGLTAAIREIDQHRLERRLRPYPAARFVALLHVRASAILGDGRYGL